jgi:hypothetical protein
MGDADTDAVGRARQDSPPKTPRWVKVSAIVALIVALLIGALLLFGGGGHGPDRHLSSGDGAATPSSTVTEGHTPPPGAHR